MLRTQIYLTEEEQEGLRGLARTTGCSRSDLIREAIDAMLARRCPAGLTIMSDRAEIGS